MPHSDLAQTEREHHFVQAPVRPMDADGVVVAAVGTGLFAVASAVLWWQGERLLDTDDLWWRWVAVAGTVLGLAGVAYTRWRVSRTKR